MGDGCMAQKRVTFYSFDPHFVICISITANEGYLVSQYALLCNLLIRANEFTATIACFSILDGRFFPPWWTQVS